MRQINKTSSSSERSRRAPPAVNSTFPLTRQKPDRIARCVFHDVESIGTLWYFAAIDFRMTIESSKILRIVYLPINDRRTWLKLQVENSLIASKLISSSYKKYDNLAIDMRSIKIVYRDGSIILTPYSLIERFKKKEYISKCEKERGIITSSLIIPFFRFLSSIPVIFGFEVRVRVIGIQTERAAAWWIFERSSAYQTQIIRNAEGIYLAVEILEHFISFLATTLLQSKLEPRA